MTRPSAHGTSDVAEPQLGDRIRFSDDWGHGSAGFVVGRCFVGGLSYFDVMADDRRMHRYLRPERVGEILERKAFGKPRIVPPVPQELRLSEVTELGVRAALSLIVARVAEAPVAPPPADIATIALPAAH